MKTPTLISLRKNRFAARRALFLPAALLAGASAFAASEQWQGVPGVSASLNWSDANNWTSPQKTYYNQVQFAGVGANANSDFSVNNILDSTTGAAEMPIWQLDYIATNGNYTTLINPGVTLTLGAGWGSLYVGADALHNSSPAPADAVETITITGAGGAFNVGGNIYLGQGSTTPGDAHNVTLDLSGLDTFTDTGSQLLVASGGLQRGNGTLYLAKTNFISLGNNFQISNQNLSNSVPCAVYLGQVNNISIGSGDLTVAGTGTTTVGAWMKFNPAFTGESSIPAANFHSSRTDGRIANFVICNANGGPNVPGYGLCDFTGGSVMMSVNSMLIGQSGSSGANALGVLTLDNGTVDVNSATIGNQAASAGGTGVGVVNLNHNELLGVSATLRVNNLLTLAAATGDFTAGTAGTINIDGGTLEANLISNGAGAGTINLNAGALTVSGQAGTPASPITKITSTNSALNLAVIPGSNTVAVTTLTTGGATNIINIISAPPIASYPIQIPIIKYAGSIAGAGYNFGLGTLPPLYAGHLVNNTANSSIDLVLTSGSSTLAWTGSSSGDWNTSTANWLSGGSPAIYANGDFARFLDGANNYSVNLTAALSPGGVIVSNTTPVYTFSGSGSIEGSGSLLKQGSGTLVIDNAGNNTFDGGITIGAGTIKIGNNDSAGNLPGPIINNGSLVFARSDAFTSDNAISGSGSVAQSGTGGTLTLSGLNTFAGNVLVTNNSTLKVGSSSGLGAGSGSIVIANGSTLDINGYYQSKPIIVSGAGVDGTGAITDSGGAVYGLTSSVTLTGDTTFNFPNRWDLSGGTLSTENNPYNLTLNSAGYFEFKNLAMDSALANITVASGNLGLIGATTLGDPAATLTLSPGAALTFYNDGSRSVSINKHIDFQNGASISTGGGNDVISGSMTLADGYCSFNLNGGTSLTLSNVLSGSGIIYQNTGTGTLILAGDSPAFTGGVALYNGEVVLNGSIGSGITSVFDTRVSGTGTASGLVDISGALLPGRAGIAGTFHAAGGLTLQGGAVWTNDLSSTVGGNNDLIQITGDLTANGNTIYLNPIGGGLANGTYTLATYTGTLNGSFGAVQTTTLTSYTLVLTNVTTTSPKQLRVIVSGNSAPSLLVWNNAAGNAQWDVQSSANWSNVTAHLASDVFHFLDAVVLDDTINGSLNPATTITIPADQIVVPSALTNNSTVDYTITGSGRISGSGPLVKSGPSTLTLSSAGDFTGPVTIAGGMIKTAGGGTLNSVSSITITNSGTLNFAGNTLAGNKPVTVSGAGVEGKGALFNSGGEVYSQVLNITLAGDATFGNSNRLDITSGSAISGPFKITVKFLGGYGEWDTVNLATNVGDIEIAQGQLGIKGMGETFGNSNRTITVDSGAALTFWTSSVGTNSGYSKNIYVKTNAIFSYRVDKDTYFNANVTLEGGSELNFYGGVNNPKTLYGAYVLNGPVHLQTGESPVTFSNTVSGPGGFVWNNYNNEITFAAANSYSGPSVIGNGRKLNLSGSGSIANSSLIFFGGGDSSSVRLDVSGRSDKTLTLADGQTLAGIGTINGNLNVSANATIAPAGTNILIGITTGGNAVGTLRVTNSITLNGTTVIKLNGNGSNDKLQSASIVLGGSLNLVNISGSPLAADDTFQIFNAASLSGSLPVISPATPGTGLAWDTSALLSAGTLKVIATSAGPTIGSISISGGNVILSGTNSGSSGTFHVLTSTNLAKPLADWDVLTSGTFDGNGAFAITNALGTGSQRFYILQTS